MNILRPLTFAVIMAVGGLYTATAQATILSPVNLVAGPKTRAATMQVTNDGSQRQTLDVRVMRWEDTGANGADVLEPTTSVIPSRPVLTIEPSKTVTLRFLISERTDKAQDNYRVIINDITPNTSDQVSVRLRQILPLFVVNDEQAKAALVLKDGTLTNNGARHARITSYRNLEGKKVDVLRYVLPGKSVSLPIKAVEDVTYNDNIY